MTTALAIPSNEHPKDVRTGLTLPLSKYLASQDLAKHRAVVAVELEVLAKKLDRFGWDRDRGTPAHDRLMLDWMDALQDYPLDEVRAACRAAVLANPNKMPNEGHVVSEIMKARAVKAEEFRRMNPPAPEQKRKRPSAEAKARCRALVAASFPSLSRANRVEPAITEIIDEVSKESGVSVKEILGASRIQEIVQARHAAMWIAANAGHSFSDIGRAMNRDHTSVSNGVSQAEKRMKENEKCKF